MTEKNSIDNTNSYCYAVTVSTTYQINLLNAKFPCYRNKNELRKIKRTESLKQRISMFEAARARSNQTDSPPQGNRL